MRGIYTCPSASGPQGLTAWEWGLSALGKHLPQVCPVPPADTGSGGRGRTGESPSSNLPSTWRAQGGVGISQAFVPHCLYTMPQLGTTFPQHSPGLEREIPVRTSQSWPSVPTAVLPFPPAPENIITKQSYTKSKVTLFLSRLFLRNKSNWISAAKKTRGYLLKNENLWIPVPSQSESHFKNLDVKSNFGEKHEKTT